RIRVDDAAIDDRPVSLQRSALFEQRRPGRLDEPDTGRGAFGNTLQMPLEGVTALHGEGVLTRQAALALQGDCLGLRVDVSRHDLHCHDVILVLSAHPAEGKSTDHYLSARSPRRGALPASFQSAFSPLPMNVV